MEYAGIDPNLLLAKMSNGDDDDKTMWLFMLLLLYGKDGFGGGRGGEAVALHDLNATQNALSAAVVASQNAVTERTLDITRDAAANALRNETGQMTIQSAVERSAFNLQSGQCDIRQAVSDCCCQLGIQVKDVAYAVKECCCQLGIGQKELQNALEKCCCETQNMIQFGFAQNQNAICQQTNDIVAAVTGEGRATRDLITQNRMDDLQAQLQICRDDNSNLRQTETILAAVREQCGHHGHHGGGGWSPPGQGKGK